MADLPKFKKNNPTTKEEKLICELANNLQDVSNAFIKLNFNSIGANGLFSIIRDASISYTAGTISRLSVMLSEKKQIPEFVFECQEIFNKYINEMVNK